MIWFPFLVLRGKKKVGFISENFNFHLTTKIKSPNIFLIILNLLCLHFQKVALNSMANLMQKSTQHPRASKDWETIKKEASRM